MTATPLLDLNLRATQGGEWGIVEVRTFIESAFEGDKRIVAKLPPKQQLVAKSTNVLTNGLILSASLTNEDFAKDFRNYNYFGRADQDAEILNDFQTYPLDDPSSIRVCDNCKMHPMVKPIFSQVIEGGRNTFDLCYFCFYGSDKRSEFLNCSCPIEIKK